MALEGDLQIFSLPDILQVVSHQQKTGILTVQGEQDILAVSFLRGEIVAADALNQNFEDGLGDVLASQGLMRPDEFARYSEDHRASGERFSEFLVQRGALSRAQLLNALRVQTYRLLLQVLRWREGEFKFYSGEEVSYEEGMVPIGVEEVLLRSIGDLAGEGTLSGALPHGFVAYERQLVSRPIRVGTRDAEGGKRDGDVLWVSPDEKTILDQLDGHSTADEVAQRSGLGEYKTLYALFRLLQVGLAKPVAESGSVAEPEPPSAPTPAPAQTAAPATVPTTAPATGSLARSAAAAPAKGSAPPDAAPVESAPARRERRLAAGFAAAAALAALALAATVARVPTRLLLPFPGEVSARHALEKQLRLGRYLAIDRGARTFYLLEGRYPRSLGELVDRRLLTPRARRDPSGAPLLLAAQAETYRLRLLVQGEPVADLGVAESVAGDFLLDRNFFVGLRDEVGVPLVLLD